MKRSAVVLSFASLLLLAAGLSPSTTEQTLQELAPFAAGNTTFAFDLHRQLVQPGTNLVYSPYSLTAALALVQSGARASTQQQITNALHLPETPECQAALGRIRDSLVEAGKARNVELVTATGLWAQKDYGFHAGFLDSARSNFAATVQLVDFSSGSNALLARINTWASAQTKGKISNLLLPGEISPDTRLVFVNTLYFTGQWESQFLPRLTQNKPFSASPSQSVTVPMMRQSQVFRYAESELVQFVELPYAGAALSMIVLLPRTPDGLADLERQLSWNQLTNWTANTHERRVDLELPRFTINSRLPLIEPLSALGIVEAFQRAKADFSGMAQQKPLWIYFLKQYAVIEVNEEGTVAAAVTGGGIACSQAPAPATFHADHPFIFCIRDNGTGVILFMGRVVNPAQS